MEALLDLSRKKVIVRSTSGRVRDGSLEISLTMFSTIENTTCVLSPSFYYLRGNEFAASINFLAYNAYDLSNAQARNELLEDLQSRAREIDLDFATFTQDDQFVASYLHNPLSIASQSPMLLVCVTHYLGMIDMLWRREENTNVKPLFFSIINRIHSYIGENLKKLSQGGLLLMYDHSSEPLPPSSKK